MPNTESLKFLGDSPDDSSKGPDTKSNIIMPEEAAKAEPPKVIAEEPEEVSTGAWMSRAAQSEFVNNDQIEDYKANGWKLKG